MVVCRYLQHYQRPYRKKVMSSQNWKSRKATSPFLSNHVERNHHNNENVSNKLYVSPHSACDHKNTTNDTNKCGHGKENVT